MRIFAIVLTALFVMVGITSLPQTAFAAGHNSQGMLGTNGKDVVAAECPANEALVGFSGRTGRAIDQIQLLCATIQADGTFGEPHPFRDTYGGFGGGPARTVCDRNARIKATHIGLVPDANMISGIRIKCVAQNGETKDKLFGYFSDQEKNKDCTYVFCTEGKTADYSCPDEYFTGIHVRFDTAVRGLGFLCDSRSAVAPPPAPAAPPPPKVYKQTGKAKSDQAPAGPQLVLRQTILGKWRMQADGGNVSNAEFYPNGQGIGPTGRDMLPIAITGKFTDASGNGDLDGTFQGLMQENRQMIVNFVRKNGSTGTCQLTYEVNGQSIVGNCGEKGTSFIWRGTRIK